MSIPLPLSAGPHPHQIVGAGTTKPPDRLAGLTLADLQELERELSIRVWEDKAPGCEFSPELVIYPGCG